MTPLPEFQPAAPRVQLDLVLGELEVTAAPTPAGSSWSAAAELDEILGPPLGSRAS